MNERVAFESRISSRDAIGGTVLSWTPAGEVWASVDAITGREANVADQIEAVTSIRVICRRRDDVDQKWRVKWRGRTLSIEAVLPHADRDRIILLCSEGINQSDL